MGVGFRVGGLEFRVKLRGVRLLKVFFRVHDHREAGEHSQTDLEHLPSGEFGARRFVIMTTCC